jgi:hypothetical protein
MAGRVGRPPKERFQYVGACANLLNDSERASLIHDLSQLKCVAQLPMKQRWRLFAVLEKALIDYRLMVELNGKRPSPQGNKKKVHVSFMLYSCRVAWINAAGIKKASLWQRDKSLGGEESPPVQMARTCLFAATGMPYTASLRQQFHGAARWIRPPSKRK